MSHAINLKPLAALLLAAAALVGCGGDAEPPPPPVGSPPAGAGPDTTAPTVAIANDVSAPTASGPVTFTFVFSEDVGVSFEAADVVVTGGTAGAFARVGGTQATLLVTPTPNTTGTMTVSVPASRFSDLAGNANTAAATVSKNYDVRLPTAPATAAPTPPTRAAGDVLSIFSDAYTPIPGIDLNPNWGQSTVPTTELIAGNATRKYATLNYQGIDFSGNPINVSTMTRLHIDVWTADVASIQVSIISNGAENAVTLTPTPSSWSSFDIDLAQYTVPNKNAIIQIKIEGTPGGGTLYFDNLYFWKPAGTGGGGCGTAAPTCAPTTAIPAGSIVIYSDAASVAGLDTAPVWGQSPPVVASEVTIANNKSLKYVFGALYQGIDWSASPQNVSSKTTLHLDFFSPDVSSVKVSIISNGLENAVTVPVTPGSWNPIDIDLAQYTVPNKNAIIQIKLEPNVAGTLYVDNIYFHGSTGGGGASCGTTAPTCAPTTTIPAGSTVIYSDAVSVSPLDTAPIWGQSPPVTASEVTIASNKSLKYVFGALYQGIDWSGNPQNVTTKGTLHLDVWTADVASVKVSLIGGGSENGITKTLTAGSWTSIDIPLSQYTSPNLAAIIQMKLEPNVAGTIYVDNIYFHGAASGGGGGGGTFTGGIFASDYSGNLGAGTAKSDKNGTVGFFVDPRLFAIKIFEDGSVCGSACNPGGIFNFYYGIGKPATPTYADAYFGAFVNAPGNAAADASAYAKVKLKFWGDAESWEKTNFTAQVDVLLQGPANAACTNPSGRPEITKTVAAQKIGAGSEYVISKSEFTLTANCGGAYTVNSVWSAVGAVVVRLTGSSNLNYVNLTPSTPPSYPTFINIGPISFVN
jgi:Bacterial Ig-like domain